MERHEKESIRRSMAKEIKSICRSYGLYGNVIYYEPSPFASSNRNRLYLVAGTDPALGRDILPKSFYPEELLRRQKRTSNLVYPNVWVYDLSSEPDEIQATEALVEYCKQAEFLSQLYGEYSLPPPEKLRLSEVNQLIYYRDCIMNPRIGINIAKKARKNLNWFFRREKQTGFRRKWLDYFRSEKFPDTKGPMAKLHGYFRHKRSKVKLDQLMSSTSDLRKLEMEEYIYKLFTKYIRDCYPDVEFSAGEKSVIDHGLKRYGDPHGGRPVTSEEYAVIRRRDFARDGWDALEGLVPAYWELRDVYYKAADEALVASAYNSILLQYAKCDPLQTLKERGPLCMQKIPASDFMNFVSLAKRHQLQFYIDNLGDYAVPSLDSIHVLYNEHQTGKMAGILDRMLHDKVNYSHVLEPPHPSLNTVLDSIERQDTLSRPHKRFTRPPSRD